jgi:hypothetical protein
MSVGDIWHGSIDECEQAVENNVAGLFVKISVLE